MDGARPRSTNSFRAEDVGALDDEEVLDRLRIYAALRARLDGHAGLGVREDLDLALAELEAEAARRGLAASGGGWEGR